MFMIYFSFVSSFRYNIFIKLYKEYVYEIFS